MYFFNINIQTINNMLLNSELLNNIFLLCGKKKLALTINFNSITSKLTMDVENKNVIIELKKNNDINNIKELEKYYKNIEESF